MAHFNNNNNNNNNKPYIAPISIFLSSSALKKKNYIKPTKNKIKKHTDKIIKRLSEIKNVLSAFLKDATEELLLIA